MVKLGSLMAAASLLAVAGSAWSQPRIVSLGGNAVGLGVSNGGGTVVGSSGATAARWTVSGSGITLFPLTGSSGATGISDDGQVVIGTLTNTGGLGGLPTTATLAAKWTEAGGWTALPFVLPDATLGVTGPGASSGSISTPRGISATGRFIVGQGYIAPNNSFRFRGWYYDAEAAGGAGESRVLATSFNTPSNRFRDGRALAASADGAVLVGGEDPGSSSGRVIVYRWNPSTSTYDWTYLPDGVDANGNPVGRNVDNFFINAAGTVIAGLSPVLDPNTGFFSNYITKWTWDAGAQTWTRLPITNALTTLPSWWAPPPDCTIPPTFIVSGMSDDGNTIVGISVFSTCGSFQRGGFIWTAEDNETQDLYDYLVARGTPGISDFGPTAPGLPPRLGWPNDISADGSALTGYGGPQSGFGPGWIISLGGGDCVAPFITGNPSPVLISRCNSFIMNASAGGSGPLGYQWYRDNAPLIDGNNGNGSNVTGATSAQLRIANVNLGDVGSYHCVITGACGAPVSTTAAAATLDPAVTPAPNDLCADATPVGEGTFGFSPCGAFNDEPFLSNCSVNQPRSDVWFRYTPTFTGEARFETCGANYDTVVTVYSECGGSELACNDDRQEGPIGSCSATRSRIARLAVTAGTPLTVRVSALSLSSTSSGQLVILQAPPPAANDSCILATPAVIGANAFDTNEATADGAASCNTSFGRDVWFTFTPEADGVARFATCPGTIWNTVLSVYDGCGATEVACNDNANVTGCSSQSIIDNLPLNGGQTYVIRVATNSATAAGGLGTLTVGFTPDCRADFNDDGIPNSQDFFDFLVAFFDSLPAADFNEDNTVNSQDFFDFLTVFFAGC